MCSSLENAGKGQGIQKAKDMKLIRGCMLGFRVKKQALDKGKGTSIQSTLELPHLYAYLPCKFQEQQQN